MRGCLCGILLLLGGSAVAQLQTCPVNLNFSSGDLTHWFAFVGNNKEGNGDASIKSTYDSIYNAPVGTKRANNITEYNLNNVTGIQVITASSTDRFGNFPTIPNINGYQYHYSLLLGSTAVSYSRSSSGDADGGYTRGVRYKVDVPAGPSSLPYTITYAYAMVLENGAHASSQQPLISVSILTKDGIIACASPSYFLPTYGGSSGNAGTGGSVLDSATAIANGFKASNQSSPNRNPDPNGRTAFLDDVWTKPWTEVTFDLTPYRGQSIAVDFEADNCRPGGHFAYGYIAVRNTCGGLIISGDSLVCFNTDMTYSVPALANAKYNWSVPDTWRLESDTNTNIVKIHSGTVPGYIVVSEKNSCANLHDSLLIKTLPSPKGGDVTGSTSVCTGENNVVLKLENYDGSIVSWLSSPDNITWSPVADVSANFTAQDLTASTYYRALVAKGTTCADDSSVAALISVDQKSIGGKLDPDVAVLCADQAIGPILTVTNNLGSVFNWQSSPDGISWTNFNPANQQLSTMITGITSTTDYRALVKNGVCPLDTSAIAVVSTVNTPFPAATANPPDTLICYGATASLSASISIGTSYTWTNNLTLENTGSGTVTSNPFSITPRATPLQSTDYVLSVSNAGCPNLLLDTIRVRVRAQIVVDDGRDTSIVADEPLQLNATSTDADALSYSWSPAAHLNDANIADPLALLDKSVSTIRYTVTATDANACIGTASIGVKIFTTAPDIFVPNAFTPGGTANLLFRPVPVGISSIDYFRVYNRLGQLMYSTSQIGQGWDGSYNGRQQDPGGFVWMVKGTDYTGRVISKRGVMVLIR